MSDESTKNTVAWLALGLTALINGVGMVVYFALLGSRVSTLETDFAPYKADYVHYRVQQLEDAFKEHKRKPGH